MLKKKTLGIIAGVAGSFVFLLGTIVLLARARTVSVEMAKLMIAALIGLYVGFGLLIAVYRLMNKLD